MRYEPCGTTTGAYGDTGRPACLNSAKDAVAAQCGLGSRVVGKLSRSGAGVHSCISGAAHCRNSLSCLVIPKGMLAGKWKHYLCPEAVSTNMGLGRDRLGFGMVTLTVAT